MGHYFFYLLHLDCKFKIQKSACLRETGAFSSLAVIHTAKDLRGELPESSCLRTGPDPLHTESRAQQQQ